MERDLFSELSFQKESSNPFEWNFRHETSFSRQSVGDGTQVGVAKLSVSLKKKKNMNHVFLCEMKSHFFVKH